MDVEANKLLPIIHTRHQMKLTELERISLHWSIQQMSTGIRQCRELRRLVLNFYHGALSKVPMVEVSPHDLGLVSTLWLHIPEFETASMDLQHGTHFDFD
jgi:hypothetical protein